MTATTLLLGVRIIDPRAETDEFADVCISGGIVSNIGAPGDGLSWPEHPDNGGSTTFVISQGDYSDELILTPGLVDIHTHVYGSAGVARVDEVGTEVGVPIIVDAGGAGPATIDDFVAMRVEPAKTIVKSLLSIETGGITDFHHGHNTTRAASAMVTSSIDLFLGAVERHRDTVVGLKVWASAASGLQWIEHATNLSEITELPMLVHVGELDDPDATSISGDVLDHLQGGDIVTHSFTALPGALIDAGGRVLPEVTAARDRGVLFDIAPGEVNLSFDRAEAAMTQGWLPDIISSDTHRWARSRIHTMSLPHVMNMFLALGLSLNRSIECASVNAADAIGVVTGEPRVRAPATLSVMRRSVGPAIVSDGTRSIRGDESLIPLGCFIDGDWIEAGATDIAAPVAPLRAPEARAFLSALNEELTHHLSHDDNWSGVELHRLVHRSRVQSGLSVTAAMETLYAGVSPEDATLPAGWLLEALGPDGSIEHIEGLRKKRLSHAIG